MAVHSLTEPNYNSLFKPFMMTYPIRAIVFVILLSIFEQRVQAQGNLYPPLSATKTGKANPLSPDPLVNYTWANPKASDGLESYVLQPKSWTADAHSFNTKDFKKNNTIEVNGEGDICFDFGQENAAWLEFDSPDLSGRVEMSISEYNQPPPAHALGYPTKTLTPKKYGNTYRLELNKELYEGVRFGFIHVRSFSKTWHITGVRLICQIKPTNYQGSFACSDTMLTRIWYTGAYTVKLNLLKDYMGAILMNRGDRYSWTGDAHPAQAASMVAFGNFDFVKRNIDYTSTQSNGIRSYALYWVLSLIDYYKYTGDTETLNKYIDNACGKLDDAYKVYGTNPHLEFYGWDERLGAGFEHSDNPETQNAYKMLSIRVWKQFAETMALCGRMDLRDKYQSYATEKFAALKKDTNWYQSFGLHAGTDAVTTGLLNTNEKQAIYEKSFTDKVNRVSYSPFNQYFVIQAFAQMNKYDDALSSIHDLWGGEINYGGTTFFEDYRPSWNAVIEKNGAVPNNQCGFTSLCHPWGAGVTKWLSEEVLGIKPTSPGFKTFDVLPHLGRTLTSVSGKTPTPLGAIAASFNTTTGICSLSVPVDAVGRIGIPKVEKQITGITINGVLAWNGIYHSVNGISGASQDEQFIYLTGVQSGDYKIDVTYDGTTPKYIEQLAHYPARYLGIDSTTSGNWGGKYGKDGYVLCDYNDDGNDKSKLPAYVSSVNFYKVKGNGKPDNVVWKSNTGDKRALAPDATNKGARNATSLYAVDADQIGYTFTSTIAVKGTHEYKVSLYFLDWDMKGRKIAIEMFDAANLKLIAPVKVVKDFTGGAYLTYTYNKSAKFRINLVRGDNAVLSGIFFDPVLKR
ncbi:alpha-L-rhamnosidase C-terminal domain-containing protein [Mucilaginibacter sp. dw_454]|uniref:alpha-L-rhamnosidase C-terminal domain-containing protein n=1 Tax=Mucilaginibacter sp. dw_454 TaxID=2720079 RepID=UPI001BD39A35|nr:alpha-L-rhamnosidase C-terminal domain-containing protein [Mucilaginibacter sp. dw_454]